MKTKGGVAAAPRIGVLAVAGARVRGEVAAEENAKGEVVVATGLGVDIAEAAAVAGEKPKAVLTAPPVGVKAKGGEEEEEAAAAAAAAANAVGVAAKVAGKVAAVVVLVGEEEGAPKAEAAAAEEEAAVGVNLSGILNKAVEGVAKRAVGVEAPPVVSAEEAESVVVRGDTEEGC